MSNDQAIEAILARIVRAGHERDACRASGREAAYLEACVIVGALALQLQDCYRQKRRDAGAGSAGASVHPRAARPATPAQVGATLLP